MLNTDAFIKRLEELMGQQQLSAAAFAEKIGVQRSSVSHILSKRNKPSLDFILKIEASFEEVSFDWLLLGKPKNQQSSPALNILEEKTEINTNIPKASSQMTNSAVDVYQNALKPMADTTQIIQTYTDGTFRVFLPKS